MKEALRSIVEEGACKDNRDALYVVSIVVHRLYDCTDDQLVALLHAFLVETHQSTPKEVHMLHCHSGTVLEGRHILQRSLLGEMDPGRRVDVVHLSDTQDPQCTHNCLSQHRIHLH